MNSRRIEVCIPYTGSIRIFYILTYIQLPIPGRQSQWGHIYDRTLKREQYIQSTRVNQLISTFLFQAYTNILSKVTEFIYQAVKTL